MTGTIFSIEEFSTFDGPGIRTTVFFKGCPLRCVWCHNPEGQKFFIEYVKNTSACLRCGECEPFVSVENSEKRLTEECRKACPHRLIRKCGETYTAEDLVKKLLKNQSILNSSGGGVTFSGGEPLAQSEFLMECCRLLKGKLHRSLQTSGFSDTYAAINAPIGIDDGVTVFDTDCLGRATFETHCTPRASRNV